MSAKSKKLKREKGFEDRLRASILRICNKYSSIDTENEDIIDLSKLEESGKGGKWDRLLVNHLNQESNAENDESSDSEYFSDCSTSSGFVNGIAALFCKSSGNTDSSDECQPMKEQELQHLAITDDSPNLHSTENTNTKKDKNESHNFSPRKLRRSKRICQRVTGSNENCNTNIEKASNSSPDVSISTSESEECQANEASHNLSRSENENEDEEKVNAASSELCQEQNEINLLSAHNEKMQNLFWNSFKQRMKHSLVTETDHGQKVNAESEAHEKDLDNRKTHLKSKAIENNQNDTKQHNTRFQDILKFSVDDECVSIVPKTLNLNSIKSQSSIKCDLNDSCANRSTRHISSVPTRTQVTTESNISTRLQSLNATLNTEYNFTTKRRSNSITCKNLNATMAYFNKRLKADDDDALSVDSFRNETLSLAGYRNPKPKAKLPHLWNPCRKSLNQSIGNPSDDGIILIDEFSPTTYEPSLNTISDADSIIMRNPIRKLRSSSLSGSINSNTNSSKLSSSSQQTDTFVRPQSFVKRFATENSMLSLESSFFRSNDKERRNRSFSFNPNEIARPKRTCLNSSLNINSGRVDKRPTSSSYESDWSKRIGYFF